VTNIQLSASGGTDRGTFSLGVNYFVQSRSTTKFVYFRRYTVRANRTYNIKNIFRLGENLQVLYNQGRDLSSVNLAGAAWTMPALLPVYDIMGNPASSAARMICSTNQNGHGNNPITSAWRNRFDGYYTFGIFGNVFGEIEPIKNLTIRHHLGLTMMIEI
jgi:hypothetical protein